MNQQRPQNPALADFCIKDARRVADEFLKRYAEAILLNESAHPAETRATALQLERKRRKLDNARRRLYAALHRPAHVNAIAEALENMRGAARRINAARAALMRAAANALQTEIERMKENTPEQDKDLIKAAEAWVRHRSFMRHRARVIIAQGKGEQA